MFFSVARMHIPDGFLSTMVALILWVISIAVIAVSLRRVGRDLGEHQVPLMGVLAAAIFAGQMLNFSITGGTSGHLLGAALATSLMGPWAAIIIMTCVVSIQALIFQDGGLLALGANLFNMAIIGVSVSYLVYSSIKNISRGKTWGIFVGGFLAAWFSVMIASLGCALELALSGTSPANIAVPAMGGIHFLIGIGEGLLTVGALAFLYSARRDLLHLDQPAPAGNKIVWVGGLIIAGLLVMLSPLASAHPDGLEWVAEQKGFLDAAREPVYNLIPDYIFPGISNEAMATIVAGFAGLFLVFGVALAVALLRRTKKG
ncbi:MAG: energy-coupling factor ABC transporter permease [Anaerolineaceae bacterium]|nr:energy-coupling factor ABC transporter permease [Anaerolineaceae bacterium]MBN2677338.1 energy-coupling factor ABC transporter permease [Anaerolineaceae bacterium]